MELYKYRTRYMLNNSYTKHDVRDDAYVLQARGNARAVNKLRTCLPRYCACSVRAHRESRHRLCYSLLKSTLMKIH